MGVDEAFVAKQQRLAFWCGRKGVSEDSNLCGVVLEYKQAHCLQFTPKLFTMSDLGYLAASTAM